MKSIVAIVLLIHCALHPKPGHASVVGESCASLLFGTEIDAVRAAADSYNPQSIREDREYMGVIFEADGKYGYSVAAAASKGDSWRLGIQHAEWDKVRAFWHTHGGVSSKNRYFSDADTRSANKFGLPFYLADYTGYLKVFRSGDKTLNPFAAARLNLPRQAGFAIGDYVRDSLNRVVRVKVVDRNFAAHGSSVSHGEFGHWSRERKPQRIGVGNPALADSLAL